MTKEQIIKHWDVIVAFKEGKEIQFFSDNGYWVDETNPQFRFPFEQYRVKPAPAWVPWTFETSPHLPFVVKYRNDVSAELVVSYKSLDGVGLGILGHMSYEELFKRFVMLDGSPCSQLMKT